MPFNKAAFTSALLAGISLPAMALAATSAVTRADLNLRTGPSTEYARIATIPEDDRVVVYGCIRGYSWCDISWDNYRGWVYSEYLAYPRDGRYVRWGVYAPRIDFPIISFSFGDYHDRYYRGRPWYRARDRRDFDRRDRDGDFRFRYEDRDRDRRNWRDDDRDRRGRNDRDRRDWRDDDRDRRDWRDDDRDRRDWRDDDRDRRDWRDDDGRRGNWRDDDGRRGRDDDGRRGDWRDDDNERRGDARGGDGRRSEDGQRRGGEDDAGRQRGERSSGPSATPQSSGPSATPGASGTPATPQTSGTPEKTRSGAATGRITPKRTGAMESEEETPNASTNNSGEAEEEQKN